MVKLSSAIVQRKLATLRDVEEALARQVLYGGDLATNLLEQAPSMDERALTALLAETEQLPPAPAGPLPRSSNDALSLLPGDVALRHGVYPLEKAETKLVVAVSEAMKPEVEQDLAFSLGVTIDQRVAPLVRVREAICRDYGLPLDRRSHRVLAKLEGKPDPSPSLTPAPLTGVPDITSLPRPPSIPPLGLPSATDVAPLYTASQQGAIPALRPLPQVTIRKPDPVTPNPPPSTNSMHERLTSPAPPEARGAATSGLPTWRAEPGTLPVPPLGVGGNVVRPSAGGDRGAQSSIPPASTPSASRRGASRASVQRTDLRAWSAENRQAERRPRSRHRGPYTAAAAEEDLLNADSRDAVLTALFDFACQYFEYSALFAVHGDLAEGRSAHGPGADHAKITGIGVPLDLPGALSIARKEGHFSVQALAKDGLDAQLARDLERTHGKKVLLLPILVRGRCVLIFYGDDGDEDVDLSLIGDVLAFAPLVATALESVIRKKKASLRQGTGALPATSMAPAPRARPPFPSRDERREALAAALESTLRYASSRPPRRSSRPPPIPSRSRSTPPSSPKTAPPLDSVGQATVRGVPHPEPRRVPGDTAGAARAEGADAQARHEEDRPITEPAIPAARAATVATEPADLERAVTPADGTPRLSPAEMETASSAAFDAALLVTPEDAAEDADTAPAGPTPQTASEIAGPLPSDRGAAEDASTRAVEESAAEDTGTRAVEESAEDDGPEISLGAAEVDWSPELETPRPAAGPPALPDSQVVVAAKRPLKAHSSEELRLPSIIVNVDHDIEGLVRRLLDGDEKVLDRLAALGASAASYLVSRFPGPIREADRLGVPEPASLRGPILRALARIGLPAAPFLAVRSNDRDASVRAWATALLGEIPSVESANAVSRRVVDASAEVRRRALEAGRMLQTHEDSRTTLRDKVLSIAEGKSSLESRVAAIEAIAHFRDGRATPRLVRLLENRDEVGQSAEWALGVLTRQAFGRDAGAWDAWWKQQSGRHRIEWLIDALTHEDAEIRRAAGEELKMLTKEYFGYYDDLPKAERAKAQKRYRDWWETVGKEKFPR